jgi:hypothetical protein
VWCVFSQLLTSYPRLRPRHNCKILHMRIHHVFVMCMAWRGIIAPAREHVFRGHAVQEHCTWLPTCFASMAKTELEHVPKNYQGVAMSSASIAKTRMIHCEPEDSCFHVERDDAELQEQNCRVSEATYCQVCCLLMRMCSIDVTFSPHYLPPIALSLLLNLQGLFQSSAVCTACPWSIKSKDHFVYPKTIVYVRPCIV